MINVEATSDVQNRINDVGFEDIDIISLGVDIVSIHSLFSAGVSTNITDAHEFFAHFFY